MGNDQVDVSSRPQLFPLCRVVYTINATRNGQGDGVLHRDENETKSSKIALIALAKKSTSGFKTKELKRSPSENLISALGARRGPESLWLLESPWNNKIKLEITTTICS